MTREITFFEDDNVLENPNVFGSCWNEEQETDVEKLQPVTEEEEGRKQTADHSVFDDEEVENTVESSCQTDLDASSSKTETSSASDDTTVGNEEEILSVISWNPAVQKSEAIVLVLDSVMSSKDDFACFAKTFMVPKIWEVALFWMYSRFNCGVENPANTDDEEREEESIFSRT